MYETSQLLDMAEQRARVYDRIIGNLMTLPSPAFVEGIRSQEYKLFLEKYAALEQPALKKGCVAVLAFLAESGQWGESEMIERMAVDRTRLIRAPFAKAYPPPYENQYGSGKASSDHLTLTQLYRSYGYALDDDTDTVDFFAIELDFLRMLIIKMEENPEQIAVLLQAQLDFIQNRPGAWIKTYVEKASPHAETDFYKGWLHIMEGFLELEQGYLSLVRANSKTTS